MESYFWRAQEESMKNQLDEFCSGDYFVEHVSILKAFHERLNEDDR